MSRKQPVPEPMLAEGAPPFEWADVRSRIQDASSYWLATVRGDGRPHVVPVGAIWADDALYFTTGQGTQKGKNLAANPGCVLSCTGKGIDFVIEGRAAQVHDKPTLTLVAGVYAAQGWPATAKGDALDAPYSAPTTGPAPYDLYAVTPTKAFAFGTDEDTVNSPTRFRF